MIVLWVLGGILFALLFLLCFPLTLAISYSDKLLSDTKTNDEGTAPALQDLPKESTESILAQLILEAQQTLQQQAKPEKEFRLTLYFLFFHFQLFPQKSKKTTKPEKEKPEKKERPESTKKKKKKESEPKTFKEVMDLISQIWERVKKPLKRIGNDILVHNLHLQVVVCKENAADTAIGYGVLHWILGDFLATASNYVKIRKTEIDVQTNFSGDTEREDITGSVQISVHPIIILGAALQIAVSLLLLFVRFSKPVGKSDNS